MTEFAYKPSLLMLSCNESQMINPNLISFDHGVHAEDFVWLYIQGSNVFTPFWFCWCYSTIHSTGMSSNAFKVKTGIVKLTPFV